MVGPEHHQPLGESAVGYHGALQPRQRFGDEVVALLKKVDRRKRPDSGCRAAQPIAGEPRIQSALEPEKRIEEEKLTRVPASLDLTPYRDEKDFSLLQRLLGWVAEQIDQLPELRPRSHASTHAGAQDSGKAVINMHVSVGRSRLRRVACAHTRSGVLAGPGRGKSAVDKCIPKRDDCQTKQ